MTGPKLSTHVLDTAAGKPAAGVRVELHRLDGTADKHAVADVVTDADGRALLVPPERMAAGRYRLLFHVGGLLRRRRARGRGAVSGRGAGAVPDRRPGGGLPRAAVGVAVELLDVPGQLTDRG